MLHTRRAYLGRFMRHLNGVCAQTFNRRHGLVGHVLQGRFKAILADRDAYLLALYRYVERNPVAARIVKEPGDWAWSSYRAHTTQSIAPDWLDVDGLHAYVLGRELRHVADRREAGRRYASLVADSADADASIWQRGLTQQIYLGDEAFVARMQAKLGAASLQSREVPRAQRKQPGTLADCLRRHGGEPRCRAGAGLPRTRVDDERDGAGAGAFGIARQPDHRGGAGGGACRRPRALESRSRHFPSQQCFDGL